MSENSYKDLIFTNHALKRMKERGIKKDQVWETYNSNSQLEYIRNGMSQKHKKFGDFEMSVIFKKNAKNEVIIVSCWVEPPLPGTKDAREKEWYQKYKNAGFWRKIWLTFLHQISIY